MQYVDYDDKNDYRLSRTKSSTAVWIIAITMAVLLSATVCFSIAYTGIRHARTREAKASIAYIESTYLYAKLLAQTNGVQAPQEGTEIVLRSYESAASYNDYERSLISTMTEMFGRERDFDFSLWIYTDIAGEHTQIIMFPVKGRHDVKSDLHYVWLDGNFQQKN